MFYLHTSLRALASSRWHITALFVLSLMAALSFGCAEKSVVERSGSPTAPPRGYQPPTAPRTLDSSVHAMELPLLAGGSTKFSELLGQNKVVLVNFWATWCGPCRREIPDLVALRQQFNGKDVEIVGLTVESPEMARSLVQSFAQQFAINYRVGFASQQMFMLFNQANGGDPRGPIPQTFIFDKNGKLTDSVKGFRADFRTWAEGALNHALSAS